jgi:hypothetical protein
MELLNCFQYDNVLKKVLNCVLKIRTMILKLKFSFMMQRLGRRLYECLMFYSF